MEHHPTILVWSYNKIKASPISLTGLVKKESVTLKLSPVYADRQLKKLVKGRLYEKNMDA
jgi:hypothetical protein